MKTKFFGIDEFTQDAILNEISNGWAVYRIWYLRGACIGTLVTFKKERL